MKMRPMSLLAHIIVVLLLCALCPPQLAQASHFHFCQFKSSANVTYNLEPLAKLFTSQASVTNPGTLLQLLFFNTLLPPLTTPSPTR
jgi:hypothetical protein